jgi:hypothetical protein
MVTRVHETGKDAGKRRILPTWPSYLGPKHPLIAIGNPIKTNATNVTHTYGKNVTATFTDGILSTQNLARQLASIAEVRSHDDRIVIGPASDGIKDLASAEPSKPARARPKTERHHAATLRYFFDQTLSAHTENRRLRPRRP